MEAQAQLGHKSKKKMVPGSLIRLCKILEEVGKRDGCANESIVE